MTDQGPLGRSGIRVSRVGLGTMMFGEMTPITDALRQLSIAVDAGVNLIDTAEIYPVPLRPETAGQTEEILGQWLRHSRLRDKVVLSAKVMGPPPDKVVGPIDNLRHIRGGDTRLSRAGIRASVEGSLRRLGVERIDLLQPHWPDRKTNALKLLGYTHDPQDNPVQIEETLAALDELVSEGKVGVIGVSNETPWGVARYLGLSESRGWVRIAAIQNAYNLLCRSFEVGLAEFAHREDCGLLAYSPLAMGVLSGKYLGGARPAGARLTLYPHPRYTSPSAQTATQAYAEIARAAGLSLTQLSLGFVMSRPFLTSAIIGAASANQLRETLAATETKLSADVIAAIEAVHAANSNPGP